MHPLSVSLVDPVAYRDLLESSNESPLGIRTHASYDSIYGRSNCGSPASNKGHLRLAVHVREFRAAEAARCGCGVSDIVWFVQTCTKLSDECDLANTQHSTTAAACGAGRGQTLSFSTSFSSGACVASFGLLYVHMSVDNAASVRAQDILSGAAPGAAPPTAGPPIIVALLLS